MKLKKRYRVLFAVLGCCLFLAGLAVVYLHGEWWFPILQSMQPTGVLALTPTEVEGRQWSPAELENDPRVTFSDTLLLINDTHRLPEGFEPTLTEYNSAYMHPDMVEPYIAMRDRVQAETGIRIYVASDYRSAEEQDAIHAGSADGVAAAVGASEHEAGLALDLYAPRCDGIRFLRSRAGRAVNRICAEYGYIIRYGRDKVGVTGISYEPWHLRYVGAPHAELMTDANLALEEYIACLTPDTWFAYGEWRIARLSTLDTLTLPDHFTACRISPDNTGHYIVTYM